MTTLKDTKLEVATVCPDCDSPIATSYILLGVPVTCPSCGRSIVPKVPVGTSYPITGYEITFHDFGQLLSYPPYRPSVLPLLKRWFGYDVHFTERTFEIRAADGCPVDPLDLHLRIQADCQKQYDIYQTAMTLWR